MHPKMTIGPIILVTLVFLTLLLQINSTFNIFSSNLSTATIKTTEMSDAVGHQMAISELPSNQVNNDEVSITTNLPTGNIIHPSFPLSITFYSSSGYAYTDVSIGFYVYEVDGTLPVQPTFTQQLSIVDQTQFVFDNNIGNIFKSIGTNKAVLIPDRQANNPGSAGVKIRAYLTFILGVESQTAAQHFDFYLVTHCEWVVYYDANKISCAPNADCIPSTEESTSFCLCNVFENGLLNNNWYHGPQCAHTGIDWKLQSSNDSSHVETPITHESGPIKVFSGQIVHITLRDYSYDAGLSFGVSGVPREKPSPGSSEYTPSFNVIGERNGSMVKIKMPIYSGIAPIFYDLILVGGTRSTGEPEQIEDIVHVINIGAVQLVNRCMYNSVHINTCKSIPQLCDPFDTANCASTGVQTSCPNLMTSELTTASITPQTTSVKLRMTMIPARYITGQTLIIDGYLYNLAPEQTTPSELIKIPITMTSPTPVAGDIYTLDSTVTLAAPPPFFPVDVFGTVANNWSLTLQISSDNSNINGCVIQHTLTVTNAADETNNGIRLVTGQVLRNQKFQQLKLQKVQYFSSLNYFPPRLRLFTNAYTHVPIHDMNFISSNEDEISFYTNFLSTSSSNNNYRLYTTSVHQYEGIKTTHVTTSALVTPVPCVAVLRSLEITPLPYQKYWSFEVGKFGSYNPNNLKFTIGNTVLATSRIFKPHPDSFIVTVEHPDYELKTWRETQSLYMSMSWDYQSIDPNNNNVVTTSCSPQWQYQLAAAPRCPQELTITFQKLLNPNSMYILVQIYTAVVVSAPPTFEVSTDGGITWLVAETNLIGLSSLVTQGVTLTRPNDLQPFDWREYIVRISYSGAVNGSPIGQTCVSQSQPFKPSPCSRLTPPSTIQINNYDLVKSGTNIPYTLTDQEYSATFTNLTLKFWKNLTGGGVEEVPTYSTTGSLSTPGFKIKTTTVLPPGSYSIQVAGIQVGLEVCAAQTLTRVPMTIAARCLAPTLTIPSQDVGSNNLVLRLESPDGTNTQTLATAGNTSTLTVRIDFPDGSFAIYTHEQMEWSHSNQYSTLTVGTGAIYTKSGTYEVSFTYWPDCIVSQYFTIVANEMLGSLASIPETHSVKLTWSIPQLRLDNYPQSQVLPTLHYKFTLHQKSQVSQENPYPSPSTALATLSAQIITFDDVTLADLSATLIPETATSATFKLPYLPESMFEQGYVILMSPVGLDNRYYGFGMELKYSHLVFKSTTAPLSRCTTVTCTGPKTCNEYTGRCELPHTAEEHSPWTISPLIDNTNNNNICTLQCPMYFTPSITCIRCECTTTVCIRNTRSVQVKLNSVEATLQDVYQDVNNYIQRSTSIVQGYLNTTLSTMLGLNQLPLNQEAVPYYRPSTTSPAVLQELLPGYSSKLDSSQDVSVGKENLFISFMNPTSKISYLDTLVITIAIRPDNLSTPLESRFSELFNRLDYLINTLTTPTSPTWPKSKHPILPYSFTFTPIILKPFTNGPLGVVSNLKTLCRSHINNNDIAECPLPLPAILSKSPYWSRCSNINITTQSILPQCYDYNNDIVNSTSTVTTTAAAAKWCRQGYPGHPSLATITCPPTQNVPKIFPETITWVTTPQITLPIVSTIILRSTQQLTIAWEWDNTFSTTATIDVIFTPSSGYSTILSTVLAVQRGATVTMPKLVENTLGTIGCRVTQHITSKTINPIPINIQGFNLCVDTNTAPVCGENEQCQPFTGQCECVTSAKRNVETNQCQLPCHGLCNDNSDCTIAAPMKCKNCSIGKMGPLCQIPTSCGNVNNLNPECNLNGFIPIINNDQCSTTCKCNNSWGGTKCDVCDLVEGTNTSLESKCVVEHTDLKLTKSNDITNGGVNCTRCVCLGGYFGNLCQYTAIRGDVTFIQSNNDEPTTPEDENGDNQTPFIITTTRTTPTTTLPFNALQKLTLNAKTMKMVGKVINISNAQPLQQKQQSTSFSLLTTAGDNNNNDEIIITELNGAEYITPEGRDVLIRDMALSLGMDVELIQIFNITQTEIAEPFITTTGGIITTVATGNKSTTVSYRVTNGNSGMSLDDLTSQWNSLQSDFAALPIADSEASREVGGVNSVGNPQQPEIKEVEKPDPPIEECTQEEMDANGGVCPPIKDDTSSPTGIIIAVVVTIICVAGLFILTIVIVRYAKKNQKWCFEPADKKKNRRNNSNNDHLELTSSDTSVATQTTKTATKNASAISGSSTAVDLVEIKDHGESLPPGWTKQKHSTTGDVFYVNQTEMISQRHSPNAIDDGNGW